MIVICTFNTGRLVLKVHFLYTVLQNIQTNQQTKQQKERQKERQV